MADISIDFAQLTAFAAELAAHSKATPAKIPPVVAKGALNVKNDWRRDWAGIAHAPRLPQSITYDTKISRASVEAEVGPVESIGQGFLGRVIHDGGAHNSPKPSGFEALDREEPKFVDALTKLLDL